MVGTHADNHYAVRLVTAQCREVFYSANSPHSKGAKPTLSLADSAAHGGFGFFAD
jgi:hypothetical protein